jgi:predicted acylesterase/phospholipase RssA/CRP-like cAMP-binding protein
VLDAFDAGWILAVCCFLAVAALAPALGRIATMHEVEEQEARTARRIVPAPSRHALLPARVPAEPQSRAATPADALAAVSIFAGLDDSLRVDVASRTRVVELEGGSWLFRAREEGDALYVVLSGRCEVVDESGEVMTVLGRGSVVGELALVTGAPRSASVRARRDTELLELPRAEFERLVRDAPAFAVGLTRELGRQLQASRPSARAHEAKASTVAVVRLGHDTPFSEIVSGLVAGLADREAVARLDPPATAEQDGLPATLERLEREHDRVVLVGATEDGEDTGWTDVVLRQADRVLAVVGESPPGSAPPALRGCDLVICDGAEHTSGEWIAVLAPERTHRISAERLEADVARLARRVGGRAPGLVLSGGGARGLAHIGVLEELVASGVVVDRVAGTSMGAFVAALYASGLEPEEIDACCYDEWVRRSLLNDYRLPRVSLIRSVKLREMFARLLPGTIEAMPRSYFCVSTDLVSGRQVVHRHGSVAHAVSASMCFPGLCPPVAGAEGALLIDGGVLSNLPVDLMAATGEGPVIAVDVSQRFDPPTGLQPHPRRRLLKPRRIEEWPWDDSRSLPSFTETLTRLVMIGSVDTREAGRQYADLLITPPNDGVGILEFHQLDRMRDAGRRAAVEALESAPPELLARLAG